MIIKKLRFPKFRPWIPASSAQGLNPAKVEPIIKMFLHILHYKIINQSKY